MAQTVYTGVADAAGVQGQLFEGIKFWLSQKVPSRSRFVGEVEHQANGGEVTQLEKDANIKIVDHARKDRIPDTYSYRYIELSIRNGELEDLGQHAVGPPLGTARTSGSTVHPPKSSRTKFTKEDDDFVKRWVIGAKRQGGQTSGNELYKQLEAKNSRHTWQSWRDRWVKHLQYQPQSDNILQNPPPTPPTDDVPGSKSPRSVIRKSAGRKPFTRDDLEALISVGGDLLKVMPEQVEDSWSKWVDNQEHPEYHTAQEWQNLWEGSLREIYLKRAGAAPDDLLVSNNANQQSSSASHDNEPRQPAMVSLPTRPSPIRQEASDRRRLRSPSYHPLSPSRRLGSTTSNEIIQDPIGDPVLGSTQEDLFIKTPTKRKRETSEDVVEVPSSSPPGSERPSKRFRRDFSGSQHSDVAPVPEQIVPRSLPREIPDTYPTTIPEGAVVVNLLDEEDSPEQSDEQGKDKEEDYEEEYEGEYEGQYEGEHEGEYEGEYEGKYEGKYEGEHEGEHEGEYEGAEEEYEEGDEDEVSSRLSPELGRSPSPPGVHRGRVVSETQAAFQEPTPSIEYAVPPPEGGWDDEDEDQEMEGPEIVEIGSDSDEDEEEKANEDENEDGPQIEEEAHIDELQDQPQAEPRIEAEDDDGVDELEDDAEDEEEEGTEAPASIPTAQLTTQAIFDAETQFPDLSLPEPEGGWDS
ncbi:MAG: hypothetical protein Q9212_006956, partial [Teloschistes hypoglaucus]